METNATSRNQALDYGDHMRARIGTVSSENNEALTELVWKYFGEEITEALQETQQALAPQKRRPTLAKSQKR